MNGTVGFDVGCMKISEKMSACLTSLSKELKAENKKLAELKNRMFS